MFLEREGYYLFALDNFEDNKVLSMFKSPPKIHN